METKNYFSKGIMQTFKWYFENEKYYKNFKKKDLNKRYGIND